MFDFLKSKKALEAARLESPGVKEQAWRREKLSNSLPENLAKLRLLMADCSDVIFREFIFAQQNDVRLTLIYVDGLADKIQVSNFIMRALSLETRMALPEDYKVTRAQAFDFIRERGLCIHQIEETDSLGSLVDAIMSGDTVLLVDGHARAIINGARGWETRGIEDSKTEAVVRGPRESFVETLRTNTALLRRRIKNPALKIEVLTIGRITRTEVAVVYIKGVVYPGLVTEVKERLSRIEIDAVLESGYLEELIDDNPLSPFCTINHTDRVDKVAAMLLEGRVAIITDGTPYVLTVPTLFNEIIQSPEDYYQRYFFYSLIRLIRVAALIIFLIAPAVYVALLTFHQEMLPTSLLLSIAGQRDAVPFPTLVEVIIMDLTFEVLREAGIRMPQPVGQVVSIVGAIVIGDASVRAGLVAPATVIVVALTGIASFTLCYSGTLPLRLMRFPLTMIAAFTGLFGLICSLIILITHLTSLRSFGIPFLYPVMPLSPAQLKDVVVRAPWWALLTRPHLLGKENLHRMKAGLKPKPPGKRR
ncbi:MAG: spore germination protein [Peptococcaceae bacterium]